MLRTTALASAAVAGVAFIAGLDGAAVKPCDGRTDVAALEEMLPRARTALDIPGTDQVSLDAGRRCIGIQVRTTGTARLVKLLLRAVEVPREAVDLRVVAPPPAPRA
ncbi:MAG TPA: hypothetical protein VFR72_00075 [Gemmatimonadales bacterium]|nr:hypothetical protein [Gemmatimonadales bacterium]